MKPVFTLILLILSLSACQKTQPPIDPNPPAPTFAPDPTSKPSTSPALKLPSQYLIQTTFVPQAPKKNWDQPWQDACEEAALLTPYYYYKKQQPNLDQIEQDILSIIDYENKQNWGKDINLNQMAQIIEKHLNYQTKIIDNPSLNEIKHLLVENTPIVVPANGKILYQENKHFKNGGPYYHSLTILGFDDSTSQFIVHDVGTQFGAYFRYSYDLLLSAIHDLPDSGKRNINQGPSRILLLLQ